MPDNWPVVHPMLVLHDGEHYYAKDWHGSKRMPDSLPADLADELNRLATIKACWKIIDANVRDNPERMTYMAVLLLDAVDFDPRVAIVRHKRIMELARALGWKKESRNA